MGFFPKILAAFLIVAGAPAWAFCDDGHFNGSDHCHQVDSVWPIKYGGALSPEYADARGEAIMGTLAASFQFYANLSGLVRQGTSSETVFAEVLVSNPAGQARTLVLKFRNDNGAYSIVQEWWSAPAFWSNVDQLGSGAEADIRTLVGSQTCTIGSNVNNVYVEVAPHGAWDSFEVNVPSSNCARGNYAMPRQTTGSPYALQRLRTGVISSSTLWPGMSVGFTFLFPVANPDGSAG